MSVNYHAFQSRGVLFDSYEKVCGQWRKEFTEYNPERIAKILHLDADKDYLTVPYFGTPYRLRLKDGCLEKFEKAKQAWTPDLYFNESMAIYHFLHYAKDQPVISGKWVPGQSLDGVVSRRPVADPLLDPFARAYTGRTEELRQACKEAGGQELSTGDVAFEFEVFPFLHLRLVFWDADEDFPAQVQILADSCVTDFVHYETIGCITSDLLEMLEGKSPD